MNFKWCVELFLTDYFCKINFTSCISHTHTHTQKSYTETKNFLTSCKRSVIRVTNWQFFLKNQPGANNNQQFFLCVCFDSFRCCALILLIHTYSLNRPPKSDFYMTCFSSRWVHFVPLLHVARAKIRGTDTLTRCVNSVYLTHTVKVCLLPEAKEE